MSVLDNGQREEKGSDLTHPTPPNLQVRMTGMSGARGGGREAADVANGDGNHATGIE